ncbi:MAG: bifunctional aspartate transaminase/aspartate 4-decarboxylase [Muribaculaceae bacterium]|nr:bifunctional aspartate transaminase/aspartate 4-decarboxylase [Muribaculaceae bacterium]
MDKDARIDSANVENKKVEERLSALSPFELKNELIKLAEAKARRGTATYLNAGRGNPNWVATTPREAFFMMGRWAMDECRRSADNPVGVAGTPDPAGIGDRLKSYLEAHATEPGAALLKGTLDYLIGLGYDADEIAYEWADGIIGDQYPTPDRILKFTEIICQKYLAQEMGDGYKGDLKFDLFATEGGTAAMCYIFDSLQENHLLAKGDTIALMTPIFTPYIEIPELDRFSFNVINISANALEKDGYHDWQYPDSEIEKLRDPKIKLVCLVNPSNPPSYTLSQHTIDLLKDVVRNSNPDLMIVTDDVYGTFVNNFHSLMYELPENTINVYSFSKYFGATGWRLATIAVAQNNVYDRMIAALPEADKADLNRRYGSLSLDPASIKFIDRMVADSRMVALNHTAGLSTPQQIQMSLFASMCLLDTDSKYKAFMQNVIKERLDALWQTTGFTLLPDPLRAGYYSEIDIMVWARKFYGDDFAEYLKKHYLPVDFVIKLANRTAVVLLNGDGFDGPEWSIRASLANLEKKDYLKIGTAIRQILEEYHDEYVKAAKK